MRSRAEKYKRKINYKKRNMYAKELREDNRYTQRKVENKKLTNKRLSKKDILREARKED